MRRKLKKENFVHKRDELFWFSKWKYISCPSDRPKSKKSWADWVAGSFYIKPSAVSFGGTIDLKAFHTTTKWSHYATKAIDSIKVKGRLSMLVMVLKALNLNSTMLSRKFLSRLPSFLSTILPSSQPDLQPGIHWHWKLFASKLPKIDMLVGFSGHIFRSLECRRAYKSFLEHKEDAFLMITPERSH